MTRLLIAGATIVDGDGGEPTRGDIAIDDGRIVDIGHGLDGDDAIDATGLVAAPGFIDCHVHFMADGDLDPTVYINRPFSMNFYLAAERMARTLAAGVTTVREAGGSDLGVKEAQRSGFAPGPDMQISITILSQTGGHGDGWEICGAYAPGMMDCHPGRPHNVVDGPDEMRKKVRELVRAGADVIKVCTSGGVLSPRDDPRHGHFRAVELDVLVEEASAAGKWVMAHAQATDGIKSAIRAGIRSIEHGIYLDDEAIGMMLDQGTYLVPTLMAPQGVLDAVDDGARLAPYIVEKARMVIDTHRESTRRAIAAGVKVAMGTDSGVTPHGRNLRELQLMVDCGMTPAQAITATTRTAAELMGLADDRGTLAVGKRADIVLFRGSADDMNDLEHRVATVVQAGRVVATS